MTKRARSAAGLVPVPLTGGCFTNAVGSLHYKLYRPASLRKRPPLFVMLHGGSQDASDFAVGTRMNELADECGGIVLYPEQSKHANMMGCWSWYDTRHQGADAGEPSMIAGMTREVIAQHGVDPERVYVAGMSAGGAMAMILGQAYPDLYAAVGVHSGVPTGVAHDLLSALRAMNNGPAPARAEAAAEPNRRRSVATIVFHGDRDSTVHPSNGAAIHAQTRCGTIERSDAPSANEPVHMPGGRSVTRVTRPRGDGMADSELWIVHGAGHAWTGGDAKGSYTDEQGPNASREMLRFFLQQRLSAQDGPVRAA